MRRHSIKTTTALAATLLFFQAGLSLAADDAERGRAIYQKQCVECHGARGEGVAGKYDDPLTGDKSVDKLQRIIHQSMPDKKPELCQDGEALAVARYIYDAFYSPEAQARNMPARIELSRLTVRQYQASVADLISSFVGVNGRSDKPGLRAQYFKSRNYDGKKKAFDRVDPRVSFQFGEGAPEGEGFETGEFSMNWHGSVEIEDSGDYEFIVKTENGFKLWVNAMDEPTIDGWVALGGEPQKHTARMFLLGGRRYPIKLEFFKYKDKTASIELRWKPPHKVEEVIPERSLRADGVRPTLVVSTPFPPDDSSVGYPRGSSVSKSWDEAATRAAIETATFVAANLNRMAGTNDKDDKRKEKIRTFCRRFAERAFRRPLSEEQAKVMVDRQFEQAADLEMAVKRVVLLTLKSPRFLYPELGGETADPFTTAARLALGLWDSLPDSILWAEAESGRFKSRSQALDQAKRMARDPRAKVKMREFFHQWLKMDEVEDLAKDAKLFPGFDDRIISDLRTSLDLFVEDILWSEASDYRQLLLANHMFVNERLAAFYNFKKPEKHGYDKVSFDPKERSGVVTHPYLLSTFAYSAATSPIHRGVFITRNMLGRTLNPPPVAVSFEGKEFAPDLTMREKVTELTKSRACQNCHSIINPLGFSLEHYDAVGRFRTEEDAVKKPINARSEYQTDDGEIVRLEGALDLAKFAAGSASAQRGFIIQLFNHVAKQPVQAFGLDALSELQESFTKSGCNMRKLLVEIAIRNALRPEPGVNETASD